MLDNFNTESSKNNHGRVWNTKRNHFGWHMYLRKDRNSKVSPYAAAARQNDYSNLPPAYTFVGEREPFFCETLKYIENLRDSGVQADADVYDTDTHAFDMLRPDWEISKAAINRFNARFAYAVDHYFAAQQIQDQGD